MYLHRVISPSLSALAVYRCIFISIHTIIQRNYLIHSVSYTYFKSNKILSLRVYSNPEYLFYIFTILINPLINRFLERCNMTIQKVRTSASVVHRNIVCYTELFAELACDTSQKSSVACCSKISYTSF
jgi:hypothetical protein